MWQRSVSFILLLVFLSVLLPVGLSAQESSLVITWSEYQSLNQYIANLRMTISSLESRIEQQEKHLQEAQGGSELLIRQLAQARSQLLILQTELSTALDSLTRSEQILDSSDTTLMQLRESLDKLNNDLRRQNNRITFWRTTAIGASITCVIVLLVGGIGK